MEFPPDIHGKFILKKKTPCPEKLKPEVEWFSDYERKLIEKTHANTTSATLIPHLMKHENHVFTL